LQAARETLTPFDIELEYVALVSLDTLEPVARLEEPALLAIAARVGSTRLIDNATLHPAVSPSDRPTTRRSRPQCTDPDPAPEPPTPREAQATCSA
jgi:hypothetical protein